MQRIVIEGRCETCGKLMFEVSVEDAATIHDLPGAHKNCPFFAGKISLRPIIQAPTEG